MLIIYIRFIVMMLSLIGYLLFFNKEFKINRFIAPLFTIACITLITYFCGLLKILEYSSYFIFIIGIVLFIKEVIRFKIKDMYNIEIINSLNFIFIFCFIYLSCILISSKFSHYDNFSHWAIVVKQMLIENAFPTVSSKLIDFKNYPLGTSSWIYYFCRIVGKDEGVMLAAQGMIIYSSIYSFFCIIRDKKRLLLSSIFLFSIGIMTIFNISIRVNNLLVDFVLPLVSLGIIVTIYYYRNDLKKCCLIIVPILSMLLLIKNNAIFFAIICSGYLIYYSFKSKTKKEVVLKSMICIIIPFLTYGTWTYHINTQFKDVDLKFDVTQNVSTSSVVKSADEINIILNQFVNNVFSIKNNISIGFVSINIIIVVIYIISKKVTDKKWNINKILSILNILFILYYGAILAMYIFMMPMDEASYLAGFERYTSSIMIFFLGTITLSLVVDVENTFYIQQGRERYMYAFKSLMNKKIYIYSTIIISFFGFLLLLSEVNGMIYINSKYYDTLPGKVEKLVGNNYEMDNNKSYAIYATDTDSQVSNYYLGYISRYMLMSNNVYVFSNFDDSYISKNIENFDYLVLVESDSKAKEYLKEHTNSDGSVGLYKVKDLFIK